MEKETQRLKSDRTKLQKYLYEHPVLHLFLTFCIFFTTTVVGSWVTGLLFKSSSHTSREEQIFLSIGLTITFFWMGRSYWRKKFREQRPGATPDCER